MPDNNSETNTSNTNDASPTTYDKLIDYDGLRVYHNEILKLFEKAQQEESTPELHFASSYLDFPAVGEDNHLYIDTSENKIYRYKSSVLHYVIVGSDYNEIEIIDGNIS